MNKIIIDEEEIEIDNDINCLLEKINKLKKNNKFKYCSSYYYCY